MFSFVLVTKNIFFFQMGLPVPNSVSSSSLLMWVNFPPAPRKRVFPASPGTVRGVSNRIKQVAVENIRHLLRSQAVLIAFLPGAGNAFVGTGNPFRHCNPGLEIDLCCYQKSLLFWPFVCQARSGKGWGCIVLGMGVLY